MAKVNSDDCPRYTLVQRVYLVFAEYYPQALDRRHLKLVLNVEGDSLNYAMRRLASNACIRLASGRRGLFEFSPGAKMPLDARGRNPNSFGNRGRRAA